MVTMFRRRRRSRSHGLRPEVLTAQADRLGLLRVTGRCSWQTYDAAFSGALETLAADGVTHVIFGDILFEEHRRWAERQCEAHGMTAVEPLWGLSTGDLFDEWVASGADAVIVTARAELLDHTWLGRRLARDLLPDLVRLGVDPCGARISHRGHEWPRCSIDRSPAAERHVQHSGCWAPDLTVDHAEGADVVRTGAAAHRTARAGTCRSTSIAAPRRPARQRPGKTRRRACSPGILPPLTGRARRRSADRAADEARSPAAASRRSAETHSTSTSASSTWC
jgi:hypothetical protein